MAYPNERRGRLRGGPFAVGLRGTVEFGDSEYADFCDRLLRARGLIGIFTGAQLAIDLHVGAL